MILSIICFAFMNAIVKYLQSFNTYQIIFFRALGTLFFTIPLLMKQNISFLGTHKKLLFFRGIVGVISLTCFFLSLNYLAIGTAVSIRYTSPIFAAILALIFIKEKVKSIQWLFFTVAFIGVLIIKGFGEAVNSFGLLLIIISAFFQGLVFVIIRKLGDKENPLVIINYFMIMALLFGGIMSINYWKTPNILELLLLISLGILGFIGQLYMTKAFQSNETNIVAPLKYLEVIFSIIIGVFWFGEIYNLLTLFGVVLILLGLIFNIYIKQKNNTL
ncbi:EamA family transporter [Polaribacter porphyrae]|uniref:EamA family transporter n=2 Tax=Polaribacter porphyrae TaxID=1137780 RepID=A0A2S7WQ28_9FLAO|nr:EamA family transporter [Polaribacter porphyrae]